MNETQMKNLFQRDEIQIDQVRKTQTLTQLSQAVSRKRQIPRVTKWELLRSQLKFMEKGILLCQVCCLLLVIALCKYWDGQQTETELYLLTTVASALFSVFMGLACNREEVTGIAELAGSCFFNNRQLCALRMVLYGGCDLVFLAVLMVLLYGNVDKSLFAVGVYLLVPFLVTGCLQFGVLLTKIGRRSNYALLAVGADSVLICGSVVSFPEFYEQAAMGIWVIALLISGGIYGMEIIAILHQMKRGEILCMN